MPFSKIVFLSFIFWQFICLTPPGHAAFDHIGIGAEPLALGNAMVASRLNTYAIYYNPANISYNRKPLIEFGYRSFFGLPSLAQTNLVINYPIGSVPFSFCCIHLGNKIYREINLAVGSSYTYLEKVSIGICLNLFYLDITGYAHHLSSGINIGFSYLLNDQITTGVLITNLNQPKFSILNEKLPQLFTLGWCYSPSKKISFYYELFRDVKYEQDFRAGVTVTCTPELLLRLGVENDSNTYSMGLGLVLNKIKGNYAALFHPALGLSHVTGIQILL